MSERHYGESSENYANSARNSSRVGLFTGAGLHSDEELHLSEGLHSAEADIIFAESNRSSFDTNFRTHEQTYLGFNPHVNEEYLPQVTSSHCTNLLYKHRNSSLQIDESPLFDNTCSTNQNDNNEEICSTFLRASHQNVDLNVGNDNKTETTKSTFGVTKDDHKCLEPQTVHKQTFFREFRSKISKLSSRYALNQTVDRGYAYIRRKFAKCESLIRRRFSQESLNEEDSDKGDNLPENSAEELCVHADNTESNSLEVTAMTKDTECEAENKSSVLTQSIAQRVMPSNYRTHVIDMAKWDSFHSDQTAASSHSSVESLIRERETDAEQMLLNLGFGGVLTDPSDRIPQRFLSHPEALNRRATMHEIPGEIELCRHDLNIKQLAVRVIDVLTRTYNEVVACGCVDLSNDGKLVERVCHQVLEKIPIFKYVVPKRFIRHYVTSLMRFNGFDV